MGTFTLVNWMAQKGCWWAFWCVEHVEQRVPPTLSTGYAHLFVDKYFSVDKLWIFCGLLIHTLPTGYPHYFYATKFAVDILWKNCGKLFTLYAHFIHNRHVGCGYSVDKLGRSYPHQGALIM